MSEYHPDKWKLVKISSPTSFHYRIFGTWGGSYLYGQSWKLSSGCEEGHYQEDETTWVFPQTSGSVYRLNSEMEGICGGWNSLLNTFQKQVEESGGTFEVINNPKFSELKFK